MKIMFGRKKEKKDQNPINGQNQPEVSQKFSEQIHIMPERFYLSEKKGSNKFLVVGWLIFIFLGITAVVAIVIYNSMKNQGEISLPNDNVNAISNTNATNVNANANTNTKTNINGNANINASTNANASLNVNVNSVNINSSVNANANVNSNISPTPITPPPTPVQGWSDADMDKLTYSEEKVLSLNSDLADTDGDSFNDGDELK